MNKKIFSGFRQVYGFTFKQATNNAKFKNTTIGLTLLFLLIGMAISLIMAFVQKKESAKISDIEQVYVIDESGLEVLYFDSFFEEQGTAFPKVTFVESEETVETLATKLGKQAPYDVILKITKQDTGYLLTTVLPYGSLVSEGDGEDLLDALQLCMEQSKLLSSGIPTEKLVLAMSGISTTQLDAGEEERSLGEELVTMLLPVLPIFLLYVMTLLYGMSIGNIVSVEKTSKLMEMLLTLTKPYSLIAGKIAAMTVVAIVQMLLWIAGLVGGFFLGHILAEQVIYPDYNNVLIEVFVLLKNQEGSTAFSLGSMVLGIIALCLGFLFYCVLAGLVASFATKTEELAQVMSYYQLAVIAGFLGSYVLPMQEIDWVNSILYLIPVTSAFMLPGDILVGKVLIWQGALYVLLLFIFTLVLVVVTGKIYKNQLFYKGKSLLERIQEKSNKRATGKNE